MSVPFLCAHAAPDFGQDFGIGAENFADAAARVGVTARRAFVVVVVTARYEFDPFRLRQNVRFTIMDACNRTAATVMNDDGAGRFDILAVGAVLPVFESGAGFVRQAVFNPRGDRGS